MKNSIITVVLCAALLFSTNPAALKAQTKSKTDTVKKKQSAKVQYTCIMHPDVLADKPGKCRKCGMTLIKKVSVKK